MSLLTQEERAAALARKRRPHRRTEIQRAALELFYERGYAETSMDDIGKAVGIAGPSIYRHFTGKADILESAFAQIGTDFWAEFDAVIERNPDPKKRLREMVRVYAKWVFDDPVVSTLSIQLRSFLNEERQAEADRIDRRVFSSWLDALMVARPELDRSEAKLLVRGALKLAVGLALSPTNLGRPRVGDVGRRAMLATLLS